MFGLTFEKLLLVAIVAGVLVGPQRLPHYAQQLGRLVRSLRAFLETMRTEAERDMGMSLSPTEWDLQQYDPRRIVREAIQTPPDPPATDVDRQRLTEEARRIRPGQQHVVTGSAAHPVRIPLASLPEDDPRRIAALAQTEQHADVDPAIAATSVQLPRR